MTRKKKAEPELKQVVPDAPEDVPNVPDAPEDTQKESDVVVLRRVEGHYVNGAIGNGVVMKPGEERPFSKGDAEMILGDDTTGFIVVK